MVISQDKIVGLPLSHSFFCENKPEVNKNISSKKYFARNALQSDLLKSVRSTFAY